MPKADLKKQTLRRVYLKNVKVENKKEIWTTGVCDWDHSPAERLLYRDERLTGSSDHLGAEFREPSPVLDQVLLKGRELGKYSRA